MASPFALVGSNRVSFTLIYERVTPSPHEHFAFDYAYITTPIVDRDFPPFELVLPALGIALSPFAMLPSEVGAPPYYAMVISYYESTP